MYTYSMFLNTYYTQHLQVYCNIISWLYHEHYFLLYLANICVCILMPLILSSGQLYSGKEQETTYHSSCLALSTDFRSETVYIFYIKERNSKHVEAVTNILNLYQLTATNFLGCKFILKAPKVCMCVYHSSVRHWLASNGSHTGQYII